MLINKKTNKQSKMKYLSNMEKSYYIYNSSNC